MRQQLKETLSQDVGLRRHGADTSLSASIDKYERRVKLETWFKRRAVRPRLNWQHLEALFKQDALFCRMPSRTCTEVEQA
mmetsp:Transcript_97763/g.276547  ORF Transcript_97763/g.276547 Transcript_97763/m.276547 type:complete len:80 (-) Transcript_97763:27-266(-)